MHENVTYRDAMPLNTQSLESICSEGVVVPVVLVEVLTVMLWMTGTLN